MGDQSGNIGHAFRVQNQLRGMAIVLGTFTVLAVGAGVLLGSWAWLLLAGVGAGWFVLGLYALMNRAVVEPVGDAIGRILVPQGSSTPSVNQHSNIETMEIRGQYAEAAAAYKDVILTSPADVVACEKLGQLALRQLKDYDLAIYAYREAEKRAAEPGRKVGYAMMVATVYRENLKDYGKAMVELRKLVSKYPNAPNRARLSAEIDELKRLHFEGQ